MYGQSEDEYEGGRIASPKINPGRSVGPREALDSNDKQKREEMKTRVELELGFLVRTRRFDADFVAVDISRPSGFLEIARQHKIAKLRGEQQYIRNDKLQNDMT